MRAEQAALFRAVVVAGAALTGCARNGAKSTPAPSATALASGTSSPAVGGAPLVNAGAAPSAPAPSAAPDAGVAEKPCPPDSEIAYPPCYYIL